MDEDTKFWVVIGVVAWMASAGCAAFIADKKRAVGFGSLLGLLFGPLGLIAAGLIDGRPNCPRCGGRINLLVSIDSPDSPLGSLDPIDPFNRLVRPYPVCQHCGVELHHRKGEIYVTVERTQYDEVHAQV